METDAPPYTTAASTSTRVKRCSNPECRVVIGNLVNVNGRVWLQVGGLKIRDVHGACSACGAWIQHNDLDYVLADLTGVEVES